MANIKRNLHHQAAIQARLGNVMANLPPAVLRNGAKQLRPLGLLAFLWRYPDIEAALREAIWSLAGRERSGERQGINVFIANSLVGGTGSSSFIDVAHVVRDLFDELGTLADFCYVTGVGLLPQAFSGIHGPNIIPNTVASLKELNHCMMQGGFRARYPNGRMITTEQPPFNIYYLVDGIDERGHTWPGPAHVCRMAAEAIFLQIGSQIGQKHENDFDNLDDVLVQHTRTGEGTFHGSFGLASLVFSGPDIAQACAAGLAEQVVEKLVLAPVEPTATETETEHDDTPSLLDQFITQADLQPDRFFDHLKRDDQGMPLSVDLPLPNTINRLPPQNRPERVIGYVREYDRTRLLTDFKGMLSRNEKQQWERLQTDLHTWLTRLAARQGVRQAEAFLQSLNRWLDTQTTFLSQPQAKLEQQLTHLNEGLNQQEAALIKAGSSFFIGRKQRVARAQQAYLTLAEQAFTTRWESTVSATRLTLLNNLNQHCLHYLSTTQDLITRLQTITRELHSAAKTYVDTLTADGVTTHLVADQALVDALYEQYRCPLTDIYAKLYTDEIASPYDWQAWSMAELVAYFQEICLPPFTAIKHMSIETALTLNPQSPTPEAHYRWLMAQATPSWNLDRTRLPDGGASLQQVSVLGIPDEADTHFHPQAAMLVSTGDTSRLTVFVAHVGAAFTALQQWESYLRSYEAAQGRTPLHILPQFQSDDTRAKQAFALGLLFGFIQSQGSHFYYHPVDALERPIRLAQGLAKALHAFLQQDTFVHTIWERVEQVVAQQGVETTLQQLGQYYASAQRESNGDEVVRELKQAVRAYADELRQIHQFTQSHQPSATPVYAQRVHQNGEHTHD